jgi:hypothetical protein
MGLDKFGQQQENLGPAEWFRPEAMDPVGNQIRVKAGYMFASGHKIMAPNPDVNGNPQDQLTGGFAVVAPGFQRYDLVYLDQNGAPVILQGTAVAAGTAKFQGAPGWTGATPGPALPDFALPVAYVLVTETASVTIASTDITQIDGFLRSEHGMDGYFVDKGTLNTPTGASDVVTALFAGEIVGSAVAPFSKGVVTAAPNNKVDILDQKKDEISHAATGSRIYARLTEAGGVWTLSYYYTDATGVETAVGDIAADTSLGAGLTAIQLSAVPKVFSRADPARPMFSTGIRISDQVVPISAEVPVGGIIMFMPAVSGNPPPAPTNYEYCDGTVVTTNGPLFGLTKPTLMKTAGGGSMKMARGVDLTAGAHGGGPGPAAGADTHGHTVNSHNHGGSISGNTGMAGSHSHGINNDGGHTHTPIFQNGNSNNTGGGNKWTGTGPGDFELQNINTDNQGSHNHGGTNVIGDHQHTVGGSVNSESPGTDAQSNVPVYQSVCFIIRCR